jgi:hypothetical protein
MSSNEYVVQLPTASDATRRRVTWLLELAALQTALTIGHFLYGAHVYQEPSRQHVVIPAVVFLSIALLLGGSYRWRPNRISLWLFVVELALIYVGLFGGFHGGFNHAAKDLFYLHGVDPDVLAGIFDSPDFVVPDDALFELSGLAGLAVGLAIAVVLVQLVRGRPRRGTR